MPFYHIALATLASTFCITPAIASDSKPDRFNFVIIGGGTAGLAVANRLSEIPDLIVAVIEAGEDEGNNPNVTSVEGFGGGTGFNTHIDWLYETTEQTHAGGRQLEYHSGKAWGGTSTINGMTYIRAEDAQIDAWERVGNTGWNWTSLWPYHLKSEQFGSPSQAQLAVGASYMESYHGRTGPVNVAYQYGLHNGSFASLVNHAWQNLGMSFNPDVSGGNLRGFFNRPNLAIIRGHVDRISWADTKGSRALADGVEYTAPDGSVKILYAKKEVIVAAGSVRSPAILELSGVGNPKIMEQLDIPVKVPLPSVGEKGLEQPNSFMMYSSNSTFDGFVPYVTYMTASDILGPETQTISAQIASQLKSWAAQIAEDSGHAISASAIEQLYQVQHDLIFNHDVPFVEILTTALGENVGSAFFILLPFSRGSVHINSADSSDYPSVNPNYFQINWDLILQRKVAQTVAKFWHTNPVHSLVGQRLEPPISDLPSNATDEVWDNWVISSFTANHHLLGTTVMLPRELGGVVDSNLVVYGTQNVRVVDDRREATRFTCGS
ncbi:hypothetical protein BDV12DRAFT_194553 [Aspergillus spectabilis]